MLLKQRDALPGRRLLNAAVILLTMCSLGASAWETRDDALAQAVKLINSPEHFGVSTLSTKYPANHPIAELADSVISGPEYFAPCDAATGSLLYLGLTVSQTWKNVLNSEAKNATSTIVSNSDPAVPDPRHTSKHNSKHWANERPSWRRGMPSKARVTLFGHFDILNVTHQPEQAEKALSCYLDHHPDASHWAPNATESPHVPFWAKFSVNKVYWIGGFGDEHYIGWFSSEEWNTAWQKGQRSLSRESRADLYAGWPIATADDAFSQPAATSAEDDPQHSPEDLLPRLSFQ